MYEITTRVKDSAYDSQSQGGMLEAGLIKRGPLNDQEIAQFHAALQAMSTIFFGLIIAGINDGSYQRELNPPRPCTSSLWFELKLQPAEGVTISFMLYARTIDAILNRDHYGIWVIRHIDAAIERVGRAYGRKEPAAALRRWVQEEIQGGQSPSTTSTSTHSPVGLTARVMCWGLAGLLHAQRCP